MVFVCQIHLFEMVFFTIFSNLFLLEICLGKNSAHSSQCGLGLSL